MICDAMASHEWLEGWIISDRSGASGARQPAEDFVGNGRFLVQQRLGAGAFGVVYEAFDRQERSRVALKVLRFNEADALYRFKKGFRSLADIRHPNLISFYELFTDDGTWFFSMERVRGVDFIEHLRGVSAETAASTASMTASGETEPSTLSDGTDRVDATPADATPTDATPADAAPADPALRTEVDFARTRRALRQLALGLQALHGHGKVHRDIKPPNVLVDGDGRVVLLDFGLVTELQQATRRKTAPEQALVGTPAYMSPEQAMGEPGSPASDWYSVGVMLFQAMSGALPFEGSLAQVLMAKQQQPPPNLRQWVPEVPDDLHTLCSGLLEPDPRLRLRGEQVLAMLRSASEDGTADDPSDLEANASRWTSSQALRRAVLDLAPPDAPFVGRRRILQRLEDAYDDCRRQVVMVYLRGRSGMGKSALLQHFVRRLDRYPEEAVVLSGRCYLQESVPYKALDSVVDALSRYLMTLHRQEVEVLLPARVASLVRLFPVLLRVEAIDRQYRPNPEVVDPQGVRRRACAALREMLDRLASRHRVVMVIDDLQWGDVDSFYLLDELFKGPDPPPFLFIGSYRLEDEHNSPFLSALLEHGETLRRRGVDLRQIDVEPLTDGEAESMVLALDPQGDVGADRLLNLLQEAGGSPLFLSELVRYSSRRRGVDRRLHQIPSRRQQDLQLSDLILGRVEQVSPLARRLLEVVAVAGQPVDLEVARLAAELQSGGSEVVAELRRHNLLRQTVVEDHVELETYHDRIRDVVSKRLSSAALRQIHGRLALALEATGQAAAETLAVHFQATEEVERAQAYVVRAAGRAEAALAFERAARLYRQGLDLLAVDSSERYALRVKLGAALANAGHSREAADTYIEAVGDSGIINPIEVQRHAAEKLLISGHIDRGLAVLRHVLRLDGMRLEGSHWRSRLGHRWRRILLRLRGYRYTERPQEDCDSETLRRIDTCWSVAIGLCLVDILRAETFHLRHLLSALSLGEPRRVARGLAMEVFFITLERGGDARPVLELAKSVSEALPGRYAASLTEMTEGMVACSKGAWRRANRCLMRAETHLRDSRRGVAWELDTVQHFRVLASLSLGRWQELFREQSRSLERLRDQGDLYLEVHLLHWVETLRLLIDDRVEAAQELLQKSVDAWSYQGFHYQHFGHLYASVQVALFAGQGRRALETLESRWPEFLGSQLRRLELVRVQSHELRGRALLAAAVEDEGRRSKLLAEVEATAQQLDKAGSSWALALASMLRAGSAALGPHPEQALDSLEVAIAAFDASAMAVHTAVARFCRARLEMAQRGGNDFREMDRASAELLALGIHRPEPLVAMLAPGVVRSAPW